MTKDKFKEVMEQAFDSYMENTMKVEREIEPESVECYKTVVVLTKQWVSEMEAVIKVYDEENKS